jgi:hypothetical protein
MTMPICPKCASQKVTLLSTTELGSLKSPPTQRTVVHVYQCECGLGFTDMVTVTKEVDERERKK